MSTTCELNGACGAIKGLCKHKWLMMIGMAVMVAIAVIGYCLVA